MRILVLGGCGAWPAAGQACSGYVLQHDGFQLLVDPGYATLPRLLERTRAELVDAVVISHGHPDHCADLNPLLRARQLGGSAPDALPVYALRGAVDPVLGLDRPGMLDDAYRLQQIEPELHLEIGPFEVETVLLPHFVFNLGLRVRAGPSVLAYTGDTGPSPNLSPLARGADIFLAEATYPERVPADAARYLSSALQAGEVAAQSSVRHLLLTHLLPGTDPAEAEAAARITYGGSVSVARAGMTVDVG
jgi:ribonuclease BN (tRNA processing enzyme)